MHMLITCAHCRTPTLTDERWETAMTTARTLRLPLIVDCPGHRGGHSCGHLLALIPHACGHWQTLTTAWGDGLACVSGGVSGDVSGADEPCPSCRREHDRGTTARRLQVPSTQGDW